MLVSLAFHPFSCRLGQTKRLKIRAKNDCLRKALKHNKIFSVTPRMVVKARIEGVEARVVAS
jgi:hypothetical protein